MASLGPFSLISQNYKEEFKKLKKLVTAFINQQILLAFMDQSYFQNAPNVTIILYKPGMKNILYKNGQKFGISVTGIMGVNCSLYMEFYERNNSFTTILTLVMFRILNMENKTGKKILKDIIVSQNSDINSIYEELSKEIKYKTERLEEIEK